MPEEQRLYVGLMTCSEVDMFERVLSHAGRTPQDVVQQAVDLVKSWDLRDDVTERFMAEADADGACVLYDEDAERLELEVSQVILEEEN